MNLFKLMSATHAIGTVREKPAVYVTEGLPSFGWPREAGAQAPEGAATGWRKLWQVLWPFRRSASTATPAPSGAPSAVARTASPVPWSSCRREAGLAQRELAFETLRPVRNDLRDEDFEVTARPLSAPTPKALVATRKPVPMSGRQALLSLENSVH